MRSCLAPFAGHTLTRAAVGEGQEGDGRLTRGECSFNEEDKKPGREAGRARSRRAFTRSLNRRVRWRGSALYLLSAARLSAPSWRFLFFFGKLCRRQITVSLLHFALPRAQLLILFFLLDWHMLTSPGVRQGAWADWVIRQEDDRGILPHAAASWQSARREKEAANRFLVLFFFLRYAGLRGAKVIHLKWKKEEEMHKFTHAAHTLTGDIRDSLTVMSLSGYPGCFGLVC